MFPEKKILIIGYGNIPDNKQFYQSISDFILLKPLENIIPENADYLIAHNFLTKEFIDFNGSKVFNMWEPLFTINQNNKFNVELDPYSPNMYLYNHPDIKERMFYVSIPEDRTQLIAKLKKSIKKKRKKFCCAIWRFSLIRKNVATDLIKHRLSFAMEMGKHIDIYGANNWLKMLNKYTEVKDFISLSNRYKGVSQNKDETLQKYTFSICFENSDYNGYITEKLPQAMMGGTVPLYWGGGNYLEESIPSDCYINCKNKTPNEIKKMILKMSFKKIIKYRKAAIRFFESSLADNFTRKKWSNDIIKKLMKQKEETIIL